MHMTKWTILLSIFWLLLSGYIQPLLLAFGIASVIVVLFVLKRMDDVDQEKQEIGTGLRLMQYLPWLIWQVITSSLQVTKLIWGSTDNLSPSVAKINAKNIPPKRRALYANSITLTPGTLSVDLVGDEITVHALQKTSIEELKQEVMEKKIAKIWGEHK
ncbi:MAG: Na+/H+ antiporter subunit E [Oleispira sp.]|nr:Na+/H+ antiporter subunit E [Oleispira sp.]